MRKTVLLSALLAACASAPATPTPSADVPATRAETIHDTLFGTDVEDPYRWLEDAKSPEVQAWMTAQDAHARAELAKLPGRDDFAKRLEALLYAGQVSLPYARGGRLFYSKRPAGKEKSILFWREGETGAEHVLLDPTTLSSDGSVALGDWNPSWDGKRLAYVLHPNNSDEGVVHVLDVDTGKPSDVDVIPGGRYARPSWLPDGSGFYYVNLPAAPGVSEADLPGLQEVRFHKLVTDPKSDPVIAPAKHDPELGIGADVSRDGHWLFVSESHGWSSTDVWFKDLRTNGALKPLVVGVKANASVEAVNDQFFVLTNDGAPHYRIFRVDPAHTERAAWKEIVPERQDVVIQWMKAAGDGLALTLLGEFAANRLELRKPDGTLAREVKLPGLGVLSDRYDDDPVSGEPGERVAYFHFSSPTQPRQVFKLDLASGATTLWDEVKLPLDPSQLTVETAWYPSKDGTKVSIYLVHKKDLPKDGTAPYLLSGYGGFNISRQPLFDARLIPWIEAGGGYAVAQLRGGGEYGESWHQAGMLSKKQNVFDDFAAAAEFLAREKYTSADHLAVQGGSNGGLLVGALMTQHPELVHAVVCAVPLLDMVRYTRFGEGKTWVPEYGNPEVEADFKWISAYSPYHHVKAGTAYPALLMLSADADDRVDPLHARKFVAMVQARSSSGAPALLRIERHSGHGGADLVKQTTAQYADMDAFLMHELKH